MWEKKKKMEAYDKLEKELNEMKTVEERTQKEMERLDEYFDFRFSDLHFVFLFFFCFKPHLPFVFLLLILFPFV